MFYVLSAVNIISAIEFDKFGDLLATRDRGGRIVFFERFDRTDVSYPLNLIIIYFFLYIIRSSSFVFINSTTNMSFYNIAC